MKIQTFLISISAVLFLLSPAYGQQAAAVRPYQIDSVEVAESVLKMADWAGFKYRTVLATAATGDVQAIQQFLQFSNAVDGVDALKHAVACLELIPVVGDLYFSFGLMRLKPALKKVLLDRLMLAQVRTKNPAFRESLTHWAPSTWSVLTGGNPTSTLSPPSERVPRGEVSKDHQ